MYHGREREREREKEKKKGPFDICAMLFHLLTYVIDTLYRSTLTEKMVKCVVWLCAFVVNNNLNCDETLVFYLSWV